MSNENLLYNTGNSTQASVAPCSSARPQYKIKSLKFGKKKKRISSLKTKAHMLFCECKSLILNLLTIVQSFDLFFYIVTYPSKLESKKNHTLCWPKREGNPKKRGDICICIADSLCRTAETNLTFWSNPGAVLSHSVVSDSLQPHGL